MPSNLHWLPLDRRGPLRAMFLITSMPVGGAETLLVNLVRRLDRQKVVPQIACMKEMGPLGESLRDEVPIHSELISHKFDVAVVNRLRRLLIRQQIDAVITVGAGDKMFWGRLAARRAKLPVILSALHSTGWPDGVGRMNRMLTRITDGFIAVAKPHGEFLVEFEGFPRDKVFVIPNGIDTDRFVRDEVARNRLRGEWGIPNTASVISIVAALRPEKNHPLFLEAARLVVDRQPETKFLIVGDGPEREGIQKRISDLELQESVLMLGARSDIPEILSASDGFALTSKNEASPVSILEAMACGLPVVAPDVGSIRESVLEGETGWLYQRGTPETVADRWLQLVEHATDRQRMGARAREHVIECGSLEVMTRGYESLIEKVYRSKTELDDAMTPLLPAETFGKTVPGSDTHVR